MSEANKEEIDRCKQSLGPGSVGKGMCLDVPLEVRISGL